MIKVRMKKRAISRSLAAAVLICMAAALVLGSDAMAQPTAPIPGITLKVGDGEGSVKMTTVLQIVFLLTVLSLAPAILMLLTSFTRVVVVFSLLRQAMGTHQVPPNQVIVGLSLFLTFFIMFPVWQKVNAGAIQPYLAEEISQSTALKAATTPFRDFMVGQTREKDLSLFVNLARIDRPRTIEDVPFHVIVPAFIISELKTAFQIGFLIYIPFLILDMVVASVLLAMGMMVLPPIIISLPFKLMLFVLVDGWYLVVDSLVKGFR